MEKNLAADTPKTRPIVVDGKTYMIPPDALVLPSVVSGDRSAELLVNEEGQAMVLYDKPLPIFVDWVEYDVDLSLLTFVSFGGEIMGLGMKIHKPFRPCLSQSKQIMLIYMENGEQIGSFYPAKVIVRDIGM